MGLFNFLFDDATQRRRAVAYPGFVDFDETVAGSPTTDFQPEGGFDDQHAIDVWVDGRLQEEGAAWDRNSGTGTITFSEAVAVGQWVRVRIYGK